MKFTLFSGLYNSEPFLDRLHQSVLEQSFHDFEWIVVNDGSSDQSGNMMRRFIEQHPEIPIQYFENETNKGLLYGRRKAISMAKGDFFIQWDHDDIQLPNQLQDFSDAWDQYGGDKIAFIFAICQNQNGRLVGDFFPEGRPIANYLEYYKDHFIGGEVHKERHTCIRTSLIKEFELNYRFEERNMLPVGAQAWAAISREYDAIMLNKVVRIYYQEDHGQNMRSVSRSKKADEVFIDKIIWINNFFPYLKKETMLKLRFLFAASFYGLLSKKKMGQILSSAKHFNHKFLILAMSVPAHLMIVYFRLRGKGL